MCQTKLVLHTECGIYGRRWNKVYSFEKRHGDSGSGIYGGDGGSGLLLGEGKGLETKITV